MNEIYTLSEDKKTLIEINDKSITEFSIPEGVTKIGGYAFEGCSGLTSLTLPAGIKKIGDRSFDGCENLTNISVPAKKADYYKRRLPEYLHQYIIEREPVKKSKK